MKPCVLVEKKCEAFAGDVAAESLEQPRDEQQQGLAFARRPVTETRDEDRVKRYAFLLWCTLCSAGVG